jgi:hypothetical protein
MKTEAQQQGLLTAEQLAIVNEFRDSYGIEAGQISFDGAGATPIFDYEALSLLASSLGDFRDILTSIDQLDYAHDLASCNCTITLPNGYTRTMFGSARVGQTMHDGRTLANIDDALTLASYRALRRALRAVGFDPLRAHRQRQAGQEITAQPIGADEIRNRELAQIHILAAELGWSARGDDSRYRQMIGLFFPGHTSAATLSDAQRNAFIATMISLKNSRPADAA